MHVFKKSSTTLHFLKLHVTMQEVVVTIFTRCGGGGGGGGVTEGAPSILVTVLKN